MQLLRTLILFFIMTGCAHKNIQQTTQKESDREPPSESELRSPGESEQQSQKSQATTDEELQAVIDGLIIDSHFSLQQKSQLNNLRTELNEKLEVNSVINIKLRALLFKELLSSNYDHKEIEVIATMLERNHIERNSLMLDAIRITNMITNRTDASDETEQLQPEVFLLY